MTFKSIKKWPQNERPRERLIQYGADYLSTAELFAIILKTGTKERSAIELARTLLTHFSSLKAIESAAVAEFSEIKGVGIAKVAQLKAAFELGRRLMRADMDCELSKTSFRNSRGVYDYYRPKFYGLKKEKFFSVLLDTKNRVFKESIVSEGTLNASLVHPREVFREAIKEAAASILFIHNHPSGDPNPSHDDLNITRRLVKTGEVIGIDVLDHVIICDNSYVSLMEKGYMGDE